MHTHIKSRKVPEARLGWRGWGLLSVEEVEDGKLDKSEKKES